MRIYIIRSTGFGDDFDGTDVLSGFAGRSILGQEERNAVIQEVKQRAEKNGGYVTYDELNLIVPMTVQDEATADEYLQILGQLNVDVIRSEDVEAYRANKDKQGDSRLHAARVQESARAIATADVLACFAELAVANNYCRPEVDLSGEICITEGRHPVVERVLKHTLFVPNDTRLNGAEHRVAIITGPNMAGKSTYMRQVALIVLMAQIGCFVPAKSARIGVVDRIFTRIGASDDLAGGQSTFMVEMTEALSRPSSLNLHT